MAAGAVLITWLFLGGIIETHLPLRETEIPTSEHITWKNTGSRFKGHLSFADDASEHNTETVRESNGSLKFITEYNLNFDRVLLIAKQAYVDTRINVDNNFSCYGDGGSVNYLEFHDDEVAAMRNFFVPIKRNIVFQEKVHLLNGKYFREYIEKSADTVAVDSAHCRKCFKRSFHWREIMAPLTANLNMHEFGKDCYRITSEKYSWPEKEKI